MRHSRHRRRVLLSALAAMGVPVGASGQGASRLRRVGLLFGSTREGVASEMESFVSRLRELGHVPGRTVEIVPRFAAGDFARMPELARELLDAGVEVAFVPNLIGALALQRLSDRVAIVFVAADPVGFGLVDSLARPGRNATGFTQGADTIAAKRVELLKDAFPSIRQLGVLIDPKVTRPNEVALVTDAAQRLAMQVRLAEAFSREQYLTAVAQLRAAGVDAYYVGYTATSFAIRRELAEAIRGTRLPAIYGIGRFADDGGLIAYSWQTLRTSALAAEYADRILRGARPAELPVQEPTVIELVINLATARDQGLTIPRPLLLRADRTID